MRDSITYSQKTPVEFYEISIQVAKQINKEFIVAAFRIEFENLRKHPGIFNHIVSADA